MMFYAFLAEQLGIFGWCLNPSEFMLSIWCKAARNISNNMYRNIWEAHNQEEMR
jgi:hypothetical protein